MDGSTSVIVRSICVLNSPIASVSGVGGGHGVGPFAVAASQRTAMMLRLSGLSWPAFGIVGVAQGLLC